MKESYAEDQPYLAGETVTEGAYACEACGAAHEVADGKVTNLPVCPKCQNDTWRPGWCADGQRRPALRAAR